MCTKNAAYPLLKIQVLLDFAMNLERTKKYEQHMVAPGTTKVSSTPDLRSLMVQGGTPVSQIGL